MWRKPRTQIAGQCTGQSAYSLEFRQYTHTYMYMYMHPLIMYMA